LIKKKGANEDEEISKYLEEYYKLDYEDMVRKDFCGVFFGHGLSFFWTQAFFLARAFLARVFFFWRGFF
jgi:hypothetical protein